MHWVRNSHAYSWNDKFIYIFIYSANFQWVLKEVVLDAEAEKTGFAFLRFM